MARLAADEHDQSQLEGLVSDDPTKDPQHRKRVTWGVVIFVLLVLSAIAAAFGARKIQEATEPDSVVILDTIVRVDTVRVATDREAIEVVVRIEGPSDIASGPAEDTRAPTPSSTAPARAAGPDSPTGSPGDTQGLRNEGSTLWPSRSDALVGAEPTPSDTAAVEVTGKPREHPGTTARASAAAYLHPWVR